jgi:hypothetical protein
MRTLKLHTPKKQMVGLSLSVFGLVMALSAHSGPQGVHDSWPPDANPQYFPANVFSADPGTANFESRWYSMHLRAMHEPSLLDIAKDKSALNYRFVWLRSFHHPIVVRLVVDEDGIGRLTAIEMTGQGGFGPGVVAKKQTLDVSKEDVAYFQSLIKAIAYWTMPTEAGPVGNDGAQWILEGVQSGQYHVVVRWNPEAGPYREVCLYMLKLSRIEVNPKQIY